MDDLTAIKNLGNALGETLAEACVDSFSQDLYALSKGASVVFKSSNSVEFHRNASALAAGILERAGRQDSEAFHFYTKLAAYKGPWSAELIDLMDPVYLALADQASSLEKNATSILSNLVDVAKAAPSAYMRVLQLSGLAGVGTGLLDWHLRQKDIDNDEEAALAESRIQELNSRTNEVADDIALRYGKKVREL